MRRSTSTYLAAESSIRRCIRLAAMLCVLGGAYFQAHAQAGLDRIKAQNQINVGYREDAPPFSYLDAQGKPQGYSIDVCNAVAARVRGQLGLPRLRVNLVAVPIDRVFTYLQSGTVDLLCSSTSDTPARRESMSFSKPIFIDGVGLLVRKKDGIAHVGDLAGGSVAAITTTTAPAALQSNPLTRNLKVETVLNGDAGLSQLQLGWVKAYARDRVLLALQQAELANAGDYAILPELLSTENIAIAVRKDDAALLAMVDQAIADAAASGQIGTWYERWFVQPITLGTRKFALGIPMSAELKTALGTGK